MMSSFYSYLLPLGWHLHALFAVMLFIGTILFIFWALKLKPAELKKWVFWLLIISIIGLLLTSVFSFKGYHMMYGNGWKNIDHSFDLDKDYDLRPGSMVKEKENTL